MTDNTLEQAHAETTAEVRHEPCEICDCAEPPDMLSVEATSFVTWMINKQRFRRDMVGKLAGYFARDTMIRNGYLDAGLSDLASYLSGVFPDGGGVACLEVLQQAHTEWREMYDWYQFPEVAE